MLQGVAAAVHAGAAQCGEIPRRPGRRCPRTRQLKPSPQDFDKALAQPTLILHADDETRTSAAVTGWIKARSELWRAGVQVVAIDPSAAYRAAVQAALPNATIVADHFHLVRLANEMVTDVRQRVTRTQRGPRGRKHDPEWARRRRLLRGYERLSAQQYGGGVFNVHDDARSPRSCCGPLPTCRRRRRTRVPRPTIRMGPRRSAPARPSAACAPSSVAAGACATVGTAQLPQRAP